ncbi:IS66-like element accessory protein TnpA [Cupriavidus sp. BIC8F]|uniref:IS66-like element accessory protein TnpA n=1 Tax=Cupriavidus sp. BIC8F TaxID=3079014 RepID=UPI0029168C38|nr:transposase [Cupriavidus sp. BIC8F]
MGQIDLDFLPLRAINVGANGKRSFDKGDKRRLVEACLRPGVSVASMAIKAGVNANQLRRWIGQHKAEQKVAAGTRDVIESAPAAFVPVVEIHGAGPQAEPGRTTMPGAVSVPVRALQPPAPLPSRLVAQLPNGVTVELQCGGQDVALVKAMIEALGAR